jgi:hypothetical protein
MRLEAIQLGNFLGSFHDDGKDFILNFAELGMTKRQSPAMKSENFELVSQAFDSRLC